MGARVQYKHRLCCMQKGKEGIHALMILLFASSKQKQQKIRSYHQSPRFLLPTQFIRFLPQYPGYRTRSAGENATLYARYKHDLALVQLAEDAGVEPICLPTGQAAEPEVQNSSGDSTVAARFRHTRLEGQGQCWVSGWGFTRGTCALLVVWVLLLLFVRTGNRVSAGCLAGDLPGVRVPCWWWCFCRCCCCFCCCLSERGTEPVLGVWLVIYPGYVYLVGAGGDVVRTENRASGEYLAGALPEVGVPCWCGWCCCLSEWTTEPVLGVWLGLYPR